MMYNRTCERNEESKRMEKEEEVLQNTEFNAKEVATFMHNTHIYWATIKIKLDFLIGFYFNAYRYNAVARFACFDLVDSFFFHSFASETISVFIVLPASHLCPCTILHAYNNIHYMLAMMWIRFFNGNAGENATLEATMHVAGNIRKTRSKPRAISLRRHGKKEHRMSTDTVRWSKLQRAGNSCGGCWGPLHDSEPIVRTKKCTIIDYFKYETKNTIKHNKRTMVF